MPRTALTKTVSTTSFPTAGTALTWNNGDSSNNNSFSFQANELVLVRNAHATDAKTITLVSAADPDGRTGNVTESIAAGVTKMFGPFKDKTGWVQSGNVFHLNPEDSNVKIAVVSLKGY